MNARFIVPATVAMVLHVILFFGFSSDSGAGARIVRDVIAFVPVSDDPVNLESLPPSDASADAATSGVPDEARPDLPEPPVVDHTSWIAMPSSPPRPAALKITTDLSTRTGIPNSTDRFGPDGPGDIAPGQLDNPPRTRSQVSPAYPYEAQITGRNGEVMVEFVVDESGHVLNPHVLRSTDPVFEAPTLRAISKWRFEPGRKGGRVVRFRMAVPVGFSVNP